MSKILITGMSAPHASVETNKRSLSFAGIMKEVLVSHGHEVVQDDPEISWNIEDLDQYDTVLLGLSPLTSLSANRVYGALNLMDLLDESDKLKLFIDAPEPTRITASLRAISKTPDNLTKPFYSYRKGYMYASVPGMAQNLLDIVNKLLYDKWPTTLFPALPWYGTGKVISQLPTGAAESLCPINLDSYIINGQTSLEIEKRDKWVVENYNTSWTKEITNMLAHQSVPMKWHKGWSDEQVFTQIASGIGSLISPYQTGGTWWTYRLIQSLNASTPVVTDWRESHAIGESWAHLASHIESMPLQTRVDLAEAQKEDYVKAIPSRRDAAVALFDALSIYARKG